MRADLYAPYGRFKRAVQAEREIWIGAGVGISPFIAWLDDLDGRDFTLEESHDGQRIAATWLGEVVPGSCGQVLQGERLGPQAHRQSFRMQR